MMMMMMKKICWITSCIVVSAMLAEAWQTYQRTKLILQVKLTFRRASVDVSRVFWRLSLVLLV
jgi:hypothetical protein